MTKGSIRWAPFPGEPQKCRVVASPNKGTVLVRWQTGPLKGREARVPSAGLRQNKRDLDILGELF